MFYFTSFHEIWKAEAEGDEGAFWGIWDKYGTLKFKVIEKTDTVIV